MNGELYASGNFETMSIDTDEDEHSIEMQLPFIAKVMERYRMNSFDKILDLAHAYLDEPCLML